MRIKDDVTWEALNSAWRTVNVAVVSTTFCFYNLGVPECSLLSTHFLGTCGVSSSRNVKINSTSFTREFATLGLMQRSQTGCRDIFT